MFRSRCSTLNWIKVYGNYRVINYKKNARWQKHNSPWSTMQWLNLYSYAHCWRCVLVITIFFEKYNKMGIFYIGGHSKLYHQQIFFLKLPITNISKHEYFRKTHWISKQYLSRKYWLKFVSLALCLQVVPPTQKSWMVGVSKWITDYWVIGISFLVRLILNVLLNY